MIVRGKYFFFILWIYMNKYIIKTSPRQCSYYVDLFRTILDLAEPQYGFDPQIENN